MGLQEYLPLVFANLTIPIYLIMSHIFGYCPFLDYTQNQCSLYGTDLFPYGCRIFPYITSPTPSLEKTCLLPNRLASHTYTQEKREAEDFLQKETITEVKNLERFIEKIEQLGDFLQYLGEPLTTRWGMFAVKSYNDRPQAELKGLFLLLNKYAQFLGDKRLYLRIRVIDREFQLLHWVTGIFHDNHPRTQHSMEQLIQRRIREGFGRSPPNLVIGVIFADELQKYPSYWADCWQQRANVWLNRKKVK